jgi:hypothetical protein
VVDAADDAKLFGEGAGVGAPEAGVSVSVAVICREEDEDVFVAGGKVMREGLPKEGEHFGVGAERFGCKLVDVPVLGDVEV